MSKNERDQFIDDFHDLLSRHQLTANQDDKHKLLAHYLTKIMCQAIESLLTTVNQPSEKHHAIHHLH